MDFAKTITIFISSIFAQRMIDLFVWVTPFTQAVIDILFIRVDQTALFDDFGHHWLDRVLLNIG